LSNGAGWTRFTAVWSGIAVSAIVAIIVIEVSLAQCRCSRTLLGIDLEQLPPVLAAAAIGSILMTIVGVHFRRQGH
jgi:hypothetical protein